MSDYTTVSFKKDFINDLKEYIEDRQFDSVKNFLKHLAVKEMESEEEISQEEAKEIANKLRELGYME
ncbi:MAG: hypothetical protein ABEK01_04195 [Candidatus Nanohaloarchaea archaeon]